MSRRIFVFDPPDQFIAGTVGVPGDRTFYLQARRRATIVSVALEKVQVAVLAERLGALLDAVRDAGREVPEPTAERAARMAGRGIDTPRLAEPVVESFRVAAMTLAWDDARDQVVIEARAASEDGTVDLEEAEDDDDDDEGPDLLRVRISAGAALEFAHEAAQVVAAGRPPCPLCGQPLNPEGHICPRRNGYVN